MIVSKMFAVSICQSTKISPKNFLLFFPMRSILQIKKMKFLFLFLTCGFCEDRFVPPFRYSGSVWPQPQSIIQQETYSQGPNIQK